MASPASQGHPPLTKKASTNLILKEGFLYKKGGIIKSWSRRYFILTRESLCYFRREVENQQGEPMGRVFLSDIVNIATEGVEKKKAFVFALHTKKRALLFQAANSEDRDRWVESIRMTLETDKEAERKDPFRKTLRRLAHGLKRVTLVKDPEKGIGCTIKNAAGHILVNRIIEDGPIAHTGVLRPGDEFLDIHGKSVTDLLVSEVVEIIRSAPEEFLATVRPITAIRKGYKPDTTRINYTDILPHSLAPPDGNRSNDSKPASNGTTETTLGHAGIQPQGRYADLSPAHSLESLEDVGNYDDEDEGDIPPPLPPRTEDALILVDPPPISGFPARPPKPKPAHELFALTQQHKEREKERSTGDLRWRENRPKMQKSRSQGDSIDRDSEAIVPGGTSGGYSRPPRVHYYEEIKPKIVYADLDLLKTEADPAMAKSRTFK